MFKNVKMNSIREEFIDTSALAEEVDLNIQINLPIPLNW